MRLIKYLFLLFPLFSYSQTVVYSDNMEDTGWTWKRVPKVLLYSYHTGGNSGTTNQPNNLNYYSSADTCFALFGTGLGSSAIEKDTLSYANVTGLDPNTYYRFRFRVASYAINPTANAAAGVDGTDYVQIEYSLNGGASYIKELKLVGNNNSRWGFNTSGTLSFAKVCNGSLFTYTFNGTPLGMLGIDLPIGTTQFAANIIMVANASGESWMIDDVELVILTTLPIELISFRGTPTDEGILLTWSTATELNNDHFTLYKSYDNINYFEVAIIPGQGNSSFQTNYEYLDCQNPYKLSFYKLEQTDYDGRSVEYNPIVVKHRIVTTDDPFEIYNIIGQQVK